MDSTPAEKCQQLWQTLQKYKDEKTEIGAFALCNPRCVISPADTLILVYEYFRIDEWVLFFLGTCRDLVDKRAKYHMVFRNHKYYISIVFPTPA